MGPVQNLFYNSRIRKSASTLLALVIFLMLSPFFAEKPDFTPVNPYPDVKRMESGVVKIRAGIDEGEERKTWQTGTGFVIRKFPNRHYILTVTHVVKGADEILVEYRHLRHQPLRAKVLNMQGRDPNGLALLMVEQTTPPGTSTIYMEETEQSKAEVIALGFPRKGRPWELTRGKVEKIEHARIAFSAPVDSGNSGGPLLGTSGHAIGIITSTKNATGFATPTARIKKILVDWAVPLPNPPAVAGKGIGFPQDWALFLKSGYLTDMLPTSAGFFAVTYENIIHQYGLDFKLRGKTNSKLRSGFPMRPRLSRDERPLWFNYDQPSESLLHSLEKDMTIRNVRLQFEEKIHKPDLFLELSNGRILVLFGVLGPLRSIEFDPITGKPVGPSRIFHEGSLFKIKAAVADHEGGFYVAFTQDGTNETRYTIARQDPKGTVKTIELNEKNPTIRNATITPAGNLLLSFDNSIDLDSNQTIRRSLIQKYSSSLKLLAETNLALADAFASSPGKLWVLKNGNYVATNFDTLVDRTDPRGMRSFVSLIYLRPDGKVLWRKMFPHMGTRTTEIQMLKEIGPDKILLGGLYGTIDDRDGFIFAVNHKGEYMVPR